MRVLVLLLGLCLGAWVQAGTVQGVRIGADSGVTRVVFDLSSPPDFRISKLDGPERVVVDLLGARPAGRLAVPDSGQQVVAALRAGVRDGRDLRVVLDLKSRVTVSSEVLPADGERGPRLLLVLEHEPGAPWREPPKGTPASPGTVLSQPAAPAGAPVNATAATLPQSAPVADVAPRTPTAPERASTPSGDGIMALAALGGADAPSASGRGAQADAPRLAAAATPAAFAEPARSTPRRPTQPAGRGRDVVVAIDAGHGGKDPGAIGPTGVYEKTVVLAIARRLKTLIDAQPGMRAVLTREGDYYLPLRERMTLARKQRADLFVSIHADAYRDRRVTGSSVYVLSDRGASSEAARWLAERENAADLVGGVSLDNKDPLVKSVLLDLSQTGTIQASTSAADAVLSSLRRVGEIKRERVQSAGFAVLKSPDVPSVLIETAFISNPKEEKRLADPRHQQKLAEAILAGVRDFFRDNAPVGTLLAEAGRGQPRGTARATALASKD